MAQARRGEQCSINRCYRHKTSWVDISGDFVEVCDFHADKLGAKPVKVENISEWVRARSLNERS